MANLFIPELKFTINGFDVSQTIKPYLIDIQFTDVYDTEFTQSRMDVTFHSAYTRSTAWANKDRLKLEANWLGYVSKLITPTMYVDTIDNSKDQSGQTFKVLALEADPNLGFEYGKDQLKFTNKKVLTALQDFATLYNLNLSTNFPDNVYFGNVIDTNLSTSGDTKIEFNSYADMLRYICKTFGYYGNLKGTDLTVESINTQYNKNNAFFVRPYDKCHDIRYLQSYNSLIKNFSAVYIDRNNSNTLVNGVLSSQISNLNNKTDILLGENEAFYNVQTATSALQGALYNQFVNTFYITITLTGMPSMEAGGDFYLDASYGVFEGYYKCVKCVHIFNNRGWTVELTGFPLKVLSTSFSSFDVGYVGSKATLPVQTLTITKNIKGNSNVTGNQLDNFAKRYNLGYNLALGATFVSECGKPGNNIRADIAFCLSLVLTINFFSKEHIDNKNPGDLGTIGGGSDLASFSDWLTGIRATVQHLFAYSTATGDPADPIVDPRYQFVTRGVATITDDLTGRWSADPQMGYKLNQKLIELHKFINPDANIVLQ